MAKAKRSIRRRSSGKKRVHHRAKKNILGMTGKIPALAVGGMLFPISEEYTAFKGNAAGNRANAMLYHATGVDVKTGQVDLNQTMAFWKYPIAGALGSYAAQKLGAQKVTNKIPVIGKYVRL